MLRRRPGRVLLCTSRAARSCRGSLPQLARISAIRAMASVERLTGPGGDAAPRTRRSRSEVTIRARPPVDIVLSRRAICPQSTEDDCPLGARDEAIIFEDRRRSAWNRAHRNGPGGEFPRARKFEEADLRYAARPITLHSPRARMSPRPALHTMIKRENLSPSFGVGPADTARSWTLTTTDRRSRLRTAVGPNEAILCRRFEALPGYIKRLAFSPGAFVS